MLRLHTTDKNIVYTGNDCAQKIPAFGSLIEDIINDEVVDIIINDCTAKAVHHVLNIINLGHTALPDDDIKHDVVEAVKILFGKDVSLDPTDDYSSKSTTVGMLDYKKHVENGVMVISSVKDFTETTKEGDRKLLNEMCDVTAESVETVIKEENSQADREKQRIHGEDLILKNEISAQEEKFIKDPQKRKWGKNLDEYHEDYVKVKLFRQKRGEIKEIIKTDTSRIRLFHHFKKVKQYLSEDKQKFPGLIIDNEMSGWSVCLDCCEPVRRFKRHKCESSEGFLANKEIEQVDYFAKHLGDVFRENIRQADVDRVKCNHCDETFFNNKDIKSHLKLTHNIRFSMCKYCGKVLENEKSIKNHELREHGNTEYGSIACQLCGLNFLQNSRLSRHMRDVHSDERNFICEICSRAFKVKSKLKEHMCTHTGEKNFHCTYNDCGKAFSKKSTLSQHERLHTGEKPYKCDECDDSFAQKNSLTVHKNTHHSMKMNKN